jgi:nitroreductase
MKILDARAYKKYFFYTDPNRFGQETNLAFMEMLEAIKIRRSPWGFDGRLPDKEVLKTIFEAAQSAPSSWNEQPWRFYVGLKGSEAYVRLLGLLNEANRTWAITAPVLSIVVAKAIFSPEPIPNKHSWYDCGQAVAYMTLQAQSLGLYSHQMGGFDREKALTDLQVPEGYEPVVAIAMGYIGELTHLPKWVQDKDANYVKNRKSLNETVWKEGSAALGVF